jgi:carbonic anhydrase
VAVAFQLTTDEGLPFMDAIVAGLPNVAVPGTNITVGEIDLSPVVAALTNSSLNNFVYAGSLTTPPCSEGVTFLIPSLPIPITVEQYNALKSVIKFNSRYTQNALGDGNLLQITRDNDTDTL